MTHYSLLITHYCRRAVCGLALVGICVLLACDVEPHKTDAELGLNAQQVHGRRVWEQRCQECHFAYIPGNLHGPTMQGIFKKQFLPSGTPANDERVRDVINLGRSKMPSFGRVLTAEQVDDLIAYLHTL